MQFFSVCLSLLLFLNAAIAEVKVEGENVFDLQPRSNNLAERGVNCNVVTGVLSAVKALGGLATSYCSAYLHIPATTTVTTTTTGAAGTVISTATTTVTTVTVTTGSIVIIPKSKRGVLDMRHAQPTARAASTGLAAYAAAEISSACSCLNIKPGKTATSTASVAGGTNTITTTSSVTATTTQFTCYQAGGPCTLYDNCCDGVCELTANGVPAYTCYPQ